MNDGDNTNCMPGCHICTHTSEDLAMKTSDSDPYAYTDYFHAHDRECYQCSQGYWLYNGRCLRDDFTGYVECDGTTGPEIDTTEFVYK